jgi:hypothetical protein
MYESRFEMLQAKTSPAIKRMFYVAPSQCLFVHPLKCHHDNQGAIESYRRGPSSSIIAVV